MNKVGPNAGAVGDETWDRLKPFLSAEDFELAQATMGDQRWRLNHLYKIVVDEQGGKRPKRQTLNLAWAQKELYDNLWYRNIILKARQVYITTFTQAYGLDLALFKPDTQIGVIAHTVEDAEAIFTTKIKFMYDNLPAFLKKAVPFTKGNVRELHFANGSGIRVATSLRGGTFDLLHISEFAKICVQGRKKAEEVIGGSMNAVPQYGTIIVESTAEGPDGQFADMYAKAVESEKAIKNGDRSRTPENFKPFFFPCYKHPAYRIEDAKVETPKHLVEYFDMFEESQGIKFDTPYRNWYVNKEETQRELMKQEFPNTDQEAFQKRNQGVIFASHIIDAEDEGRVCDLPHLDKPVDVAFDLGRNDTTAMWFYQQAGPWVNHIRTYEHSLVDITHYAGILAEYARQHGYQYGTLYLPHDGKQMHVHSVAGSVDDILRGYGYRTRVVQKPGNKEVPISRARHALKFCRFDKENTADGRKALKAYAYKYDDVHDTYRKLPKHDWSSNYADAFQTFAYDHRFPGAPKERAPEVLSRAKYAKRPLGVSEWSPDTSHIIV